MPALREEELREEELREEELAGGGAGGRRSCGRRTWRPCPVAACGFVAVRVLVASASASALAPGAIFWQMWLAQGHIRKKMSPFRAQDSPMRHL